MLEPLVVTAAVPSLIPLVDDVDANQAKAIAMVKELADKYPLYE